MTGQFASMAAKAERLGAFLAAWDERSAARAVTTSLQPRLYPYPGLRSFTPIESDLFFGRITQIEQVGRRFERNNVVMVIGGSGSGKSSLVKAGLLPKLKTIAPIPKRRGKWYVAECRPRTDPGGELLDTLWRDICTPLLDDASGREALAAGLECASAATDEKTSFEELCKAKFYGLLRGPARASRTRTIDPYRIYDFANIVLDRIDYSLLEGLRAGPPSLLILVDQFEEIFVDDNIDAGSRDRIFSLIELARSNSEQGLFVVLTMRSEFLHRCAEDPRLVDVVNQSSFLLELIDERDVPDVIIDPARRILQEWGLLPPGARRPDETAPFTPELVKRLSEEFKYLRTSLRYKPDSLPLLQNALEAIWAHAITEWKSRLERAGDVALTIDESDFAAVSMPASLSAPGDHWAAHELPRCLQQRADDCRKKWVAFLTGTQGISDDDAGQILGGAFTALAQRDDRGDWVRRFATPSDMLQTSKAAQTRRLTEDDIDSALNPFITTGYLQLEPKADGTKLYNVSHEALIRSWPWYVQCLQKAESLRELLRDLDKALADRGPSRERRVIDWPVLRWLLATREHDAKNVLATFPDDRLQNLDGSIYTKDWAIDRLAECRREISRRGADADSAGGELAFDTDEFRPEAERQLDKIVQIVGDKRRWPLARFRLSGVVTVLVLLSLGSLVFEELRIQQMESDRKAAS